MAESMLSKTMSLAEKTGKTTDSVSVASTANVENIPPRKELPKRTEKTPKPSQSGKNIASPANAGVEAFSKEIGKILKELNDNVSKQGDQLKKLSDRVDVLYEEPYDDDNDCEILDYDDSEELCSDFPSSACRGISADSVDSCPPKKTKTVFEGLSDKFLLSEKVDNEVNDDLALFVNSSFRNGVSEDRVAEMNKDIIRPKNCESLTKTRVNPGIWRLLKAQTQTDDARMQTMQNHLIKASINVVKLLDKNSDVFDSQSVEWGTNALALLGQCNKIMNNKRKEAHKQDLDPKFYPLTSPSLPFTEYLYGNETDVNRNVKDIQDMSRIGKVGRPARGCGLRGGPYQRGIRGSRRGRGRGYYQKPDGSNWPKNQKEGQKK